MPLCQTGPRITPTRAETRAAGITGALVRAGTSSCDAAQVVVADVENHRLSPGRRRRVQRPQYAPRTLNRRGDHPHDPLFIDSHFYFLLPPPHFPFTKVPA
jgi:hypothetical protein